MKSFKKFFTQLNGEAKKTQMEFEEKNETKELLKRLRYLKEKADSKKIGNKKSAE